MSSTRSLRLITAGLVASVIVWSLIPAATSILVRTEWVEVPGGSPNGPMATLQANSGDTDLNWIPAAGTAQVDQASGTEPE
ncbi:hypothetical protein [Amaricoccus tamworthensis]|uniref:hypothetical protein n=1 Tax=Amaricoccus tamworthensis TaxID=57002 RepID=UPI003C7C72AE